MATYFEQRMAEISAEREAQFQATRDRYAAKARETAKPSPPSRGHIYFMKAGNAVKIGHSTNLQARLKSIQTGCAEPPRIVKVLPGGPAREREFHKRFAEYRLNGEWFDLRCRLAKYLELYIHPIELPQSEPAPVSEFYL